MTRQRAKTLSQKFGKYTAIGLLTLLVGSLGPIYSEWRHYDEGKRAADIQGQNNSRLIDVEVKAGVSIQDRAAIHEENKQMRVELATGKNEVREDIAVLRGEVADMRQEIKDAIHRGIVVAHPGGIE